jgi:hypothetical protein
MWMDNIKTNLKEIGWGGMDWIDVDQDRDRIDVDQDRDWIDLAQDRDRWRAYVYAVMNLRVL